MSEKRPWSKTGHKSLDSANKHIEYLEGLIDDSDKKFAQAGELYLASQEGQGSLRAQLDKARADVNKARADVNKAELAQTEANDRYIRTRDANLIVSAENQELRAQLATLREAAECVHTEVMATPRTVPMEIERRKLLAALEATK